MECRAATTRKCCGSIGDEQIESMLVLGSQGLPYLCENVQRSVNPVSIGKAAIELS